MKIVKGLPPNYKRLVEAFPYIKGRPIAITYGDTCYTPVAMADHVIAHEEVHSADQLAHKDGPDGYVEEFIKSPEFRLQVEIKAYIVQLRFIRKRYGDNAAVVALPTFAKHLSSELYGNSISSTDARLRLLVYLKRDKKKRK